MSQNERQQRIAEMVASFERKFRELPTVDAKSLKQALENGERLTLVDVRSSEERSVSMIPGAISSEEFERRAGELEGTKVVTYCTIGYRSSNYAEELRRRGWDASNLRGSVLAWTHADGELVDPEGRPTRKVHVFGERWALAAEGYEQVW